VPATIERGGIAYSDSKLAIIYYAHELQRRAPPGINVSVFEPGFMPGTGLTRDHSPAIQRMMRVMQRLPGVSSPIQSGPLLASIVLGDRWAHLRGGAFVVKDSERDVKPFANDPDREARLWDATADLLHRACRGNQHALCIQDHTPEHHLDPGASWRR
jgi:NAD(P)-dependent dehydrogenase (short-subunit alcohol dehydrogenase family)